MHPSRDESAQLYDRHFTEMMRQTGAALRACGYDALLLHSGTAPTLFQDDQTYPFRAQAAFKLWVPLVDAPDCFLYLEPGAPAVLVFHQPPGFWNKAADPPEEDWTSHFELRLAGDRAAARRALPASLARTAFIGEPFPELSGFGLAAINPARLIARLHFARARKTPWQIECLRRGSRGAAHAHLAAAHAFRSGGSEFAIELAFLAACGLREQELPYNPIVALNENGAALHYQMLARTPPAGHHSLLIDAGTEFSGLATDVTRTHCARDPDFTALIAAMDTLQQRLCTHVRPGLDWRALHLLAHRLIAELLRDAGIIRSHSEEALESGLSTVFFPHGVGHLLGLQVHDVGGTMLSPEGGEIERPPGHPHLRLTRVLEEEWVVTVEPGIYFIDELLAAARNPPFGRHINWSRVEALRRFGGIRIEDDLVVTRTGHENLTRDAFRAAAAPALSAWPAGRGSPEAAIPTSSAEELVSRGARAASSGD
ncbi:MAG: Xaa-Pro dipeptidase [Gammaproteobacteria bacterium]|nr:Xaa-Pro dipeptidase [Gammaproteobacteria bacterium]